MLGRPPVEHATLARQNDGSGARTAGEGVPERAEISTWGMTPRCLLETVGRRCGRFVASRGPAGSLSKCLPASAMRVWLSNEERPVGISPRSGSKEERAR